MELLSGEYQYLGPCPAIFHGESEKYEKTLVSENDEHRQSMFQSFILGFSWEENFFFSKLRYHRGIYNNYEQFHSHYLYWKKRERKQYIFDTS